MCSIFCSKVTQKGKTPNAKSCSKIAEHSRDKPTEWVQLTAGKPDDTQMRPEMKNLSIVETLVVNSLIAEEWRPVLCPSAQREGLGETPHGSLIQNVEPANH